MYVSSVSGGFRGPGWSKRSFQRCAEAVQEEKQPDRAVCRQKGEFCQLAVPDRSDRPITNQVQGKV